jgi:hypothetical protein
MKVSERRIYRALGLHRLTQRSQLQDREDEDRLVANMMALAKQYGSYGYRRFAALLRDAGWQVSDGATRRRCGLQISETMTHIFKP